jgi:hypothetical protein
VRVLQKHPFQMSLRQFVPPAFAASLLIGVLLFPFSFPAFIIHPSFFIPLCYLIVNLLATIWISARHGWQYVPLLPLVFPILHLSYGLGFLIGLVKFWNRWADKTGRVPAWPGEING